MIAVASNSKEFCVFNVCSNTKGDDRRSSCLKGLTNPYLRALCSALILFSARAQMIAVASDSKGFGVFIIHTNTKRDDRWSSRFVLVRMKGLEPIWSCPH